jgi:hypothetical protein
LRRKAEHLVPPGPFRWQVGEASNAHAVGEPAIDGSAWRLGKMDDQPVCLDLDAGDVSMDETAVFNGLTV